MFIAKVRGFPLAGTLIIHLDVDSQEEGAAPLFTGSDEDIKLMQMYLDSVGTAPDGISYTSERFSPQSLDFTLQSSEKLSFEWTHGEIGEYITRQAEYDVNKTSERSHNTALDSNSDTSDLLAASNIEELEKAFFEMLAMSQLPEEESADDPDAGSFGVRIGTVKAREKTNAAARKIVAKVKANGGDASILTDGERDILMQYSGRGGLSDNSQSEYFTPTPLADATWNILKGLGFKNGSVLEPSAGSGVFSATKPEGVHVTGTEIDETAAGVNQILHPNDTILNQSFEKLAVSAEDNSFDAVIGNLPFGDVRGASAHDDPEYKSERYLERYFLRRALHKVRPGGLVAVIVPGRVISDKSSKWAAFRAEISRLGEFLGGHKLPSKSFAKQGTDVATDIIVMRKHPRNILDQLPDLATETLEEANVLWDTFIQGRWFQEEGRLFIHGDYVPADLTDARPQEKVKGKMVKEGRRLVVDFAHLKEKLARRFDSRIDWGFLGAAEPVQRTFGEGDVRIINDKEHMLTNGDWVPVARVGVEGVTLNPDTFGVTTVSALKAMLKNDAAVAGMSYDKALAAFEAFPELMSEGQKDAVKFARNQDAHERDIAFQGSILGMQLLKFKEGAERGQHDGVLIERLQTEITKHYSRFGDPKDNKKLDISGAESRHFSMFRSAIHRDGEFSDLLKGKVNIQSDISFDTKDLHAIVSHLYNRIGYQTISIDDIKEFYDGDIPLNSLEDVARIDDLAIDANGQIMPMDRFLSGQIYDRLDSLTLAMQKEKSLIINQKWDKQRQKLLKDRPFTKASNIRFGLRHKWIEPKYVLQFLKESGYIGFKYGENGDDLDFVTPDSGFFGHEGGKGFYKELQRYLNGDAILSKGTNRDDHLQLIASLEERFTIWMRGHENSDQLAELYNRNFNGFRAYEHDPSDLELTGVAKAVKPHGYQNSGIRRLSEDGSGILAFDVGLGKTFSALALAAYNKQKGRATKTCITTPLNVLANWFHESSKFYGSMDDVLFIGFEPVIDKKTGEPKTEPVLDEDGKPKINKYTGQVEIQNVLRKHSPEEIHELMWQIPQTAKSYVIMSETRFGQIPLKATTKQKHMDKWVSKSLVSDAQAKKTVVGDLGGEAKGKSYDEAKRLESYRQRFSDDGTKKKDEYPFFEDMGFNSVIADEGHSFKNSFSAGKEAQRLAYLSSPVPSQRALDMNMKMSHLRDSNNGRGSYLLTATPLTNSPLEMFNMLSQVLPVEAFEQFGVHTPDDFIRVFGKTEVIDRISVSGDLVSSEALVGFQNLDGLRSLYHRYVLQKTDKDPEVSDFLDLPEADEQHEDVDMTAEQEEIYETLREEANAARKKERGSRPIFSIIRDMDRVTTDIDLYNRTMTFLLPKKQEESVRLLVEALPASVTGSRYDPEEQQEIKVDVNLADSFDLDVQGDVLRLVVPEEYENHVTNRFSEFGIEESEVSHPMTPKYARLMKQLLAQHEAGGKQLIFTEEKSQHRKITRLIAHHLPINVDEIGVINAEEAGGPKLQRISDDYNRGALKIVIANKKAEVGVNLQKGTTAIHHLTLPWTPASIQQRNGRGVRQGNKVPRVKVFYYLGKGSFDGYRLEMLQRKANWIHDIMFGEENEATNANAGDEEEMALLLSANPEEMKARLAEQKAQKAQQREMQKRVNTAIQVSQMVNAQRFLDEEQGMKARELEELNKNLNNYAVSMMKLLKQQKEDPENEKVKLKISRLKGSSTRTQKQIDTIDTRYQEKREKMAAKVRSTRSFLEAETDIAVDLASIDSGTKVLANGVILAKGVVVEVNLPSGHKGIIEVEHVIDADYFKGLNLVNTKHPSTEGESTRFPIKSLESLDAGKAKNIKLSARERLKIDLTSGLMSYEKMVKAGADLIAENKDDISLDIAEVFLVANGDGVEILKPLDFDSDLSRVIYPDSGELLKEKVAETLLAAQKNRLLSNRAHNIGRPWFGDDWYSVIMDKYAKKASEKDVIAKIEQLARPSFEEAKEKPAPLFFFNRWLSSEYAWIMSEIYQLGDNHDEISDIYDQHESRMKDEMRKYVGILEAEKAKAADDAVKNHPDYKEIGIDLLSAFDQLGVTIKYNSSNIEPVKRKVRGRWRSSPAFRAFSAVFMEDKNGKNGVLFENKEELKSRFGAKFGANIIDGMEAVWYIPSHYDLMDLFEVLS